MKKLNTNRSTHSTKNEPFEKKNDNRKLLLLIRLSKTRKQIIMIRIDDHDDIDYCATAAAADVADDHDTNANRIN